ncbi:MULTISPECIES: ABC transporter permease [unclassified Streptomyces]|uniref:ABC transporter permease n=1 Tax=Streptomyces millisiae TaxID=3075542 RepID=A0ABU2LJ60_9ACTN|nr:ABC transporter permease [Streptomyces sp. DSM 44918]MDT0317566.1 ABC transporter permease [Streptomyces sp. DSM 44918]
MLRFVLRHLGLTLVAVWGALSAVFLVLHSSGDPAVMMAPVGADEDQIARLSHALGYDRPLAEQYVTFFGDVLRGDFPDSLTFQQSALHVVLERLPATVTLAVTALLIACVAAAAAGLWSGSREGGGARREWPMWLVFLAQSVPGFYIGVLLVWIFGVQLRWLPTSGSEGAGALLLPALTLACGVTPPLARVFRNSLRGELARPYTRTGIALGMSRARVLRHAAHGSMLPTITILGLEAGALLGGTVIVESVFSWPGVGQLVITALQNEDYPLVLADLTFLITAFVLVNLIVDLLYGLLDPRVRHTSARS